MRAWATRRPGERKSETLIYAADDYFFYLHSAGTARLVSGARPFPAARTAIQPQERLRDALTIPHVLRAQNRRPRPMLPVSSTGRDDASRRPRGSATEVDRQDGQALSAAQVLPLEDELSFGRIRQRSFCRAMTVRLCQRVDPLRKRLREPRKEPGNQRSRESGVPSHRSASAATFSRRAGDDAEARMERATARDRSSTPSAFMTVPGACR
jgi:hypothetical protein